MTLKPYTQIKNLAMFMFNVKLMRIRQVISTLARLYRENETKHIKDLILHASQKNEANQIALGKKIIFLPLLPFQFCFYVFTGQLSNKLTVAKQIPTRGKILNHVQNSLDNVQIC